MYSDLNNPDYTVWDDPRMDNWLQQVVPFTEDRNVVLETDSVFPCHVCDETGTVFEDAETCPRCNGHTTIGCDVENCNREAHYLLDGGDTGYCEKHIGDISKFDVIPFHYDG